MPRRKTRAFRGTWRGHCSSSGTACRSCRRARSGWTTRPPWPSAGAAGPRDPQGRSLRDFDLRSRLFRYPCSYLVYTTAFDGLPPEAKEHVYRRLWEVLTGADAGKEYARLSAADRRAILEILRATKGNL